MLPKLPLLIFVKKHAFLQKNDENCNSLGVCSTHTTANQHTSICMCFSIPLNLPKLVALSTYHDIFWMSYIRFFRPPFTRRNTGRVSHIGRTYILFRSIPHTMFLHHQGRFERARVHVHASAGPVSRKQI